MSGPTDPDWLKTIVQSGVKRGPRGGVVVELEFRPIMTGDDRSLSIGATGAKARPLMPKDLTTILGEIGETIAAVAHDARQ